MPSILNLKFKGNKSFVAFSNLNDTEALTKTWKVCTKVASYLEQGQRLENLSWRLWHLQNLMVDTDNAKSKREFKKLSKCMGDKLDKEKGRSIEELEAPDFKRNHSVDLIRQRAVEKERLREANLTKPGTIKRMQFTFSVDQPAPAPTTTNVKKPGTEKKNQRPTANTRPAAEAAPGEQPSRPTIHHEEVVMADEHGNDKDPPPAQIVAHYISPEESPSLKFPTLFSSDFGPAALLYPTPTLTTQMNYGEGLNPSHHASNDSFSVARPTIEVALDELLHGMESADGTDPWAGIAGLDSNSSANPSSSPNHLEQHDVVMAPPPASASTPTPTSTTSQKRRASFITDENGNGSVSDNETGEQHDAAVATPPASTRTMKKHTRSASKNANVHVNSQHVPPISQTVKEILPETVAPSKVNELFQSQSQSQTANANSTTSNRGSGRPTLNIRTPANSTTTRSSGPGATATSLNPSVLRNTSGNSAPGGVKAECSNCGATHTPLWRRGLNDELNCNACGLYCKLHKRPRPKSMRSSHGEGRTQAAPRQETVDVMAQCYNCHTTATPLWRKDDEGKTVCNACGLYYKLHGSARPISMKSDVIRKRSRHDARRGNSIEETPSVSPGQSRRPSPNPEPTQPTLAPDTSTAPATYDYSEEMDFRSANSELINALGTQDAAGGAANLFSNPFTLQFPGPYHPDYLVQMYTTPQDPLTFSTLETSASSSSSSSTSSASTEDNRADMSPRSSKRRRMSTDSASEPPLSAVSFSSYGDGYSSATTTSTHSHSHSHSQRSSSIDFAFGAPAANGPALRGSGNTFWHPPMLPQGDDSAHMYHNTTANSNNTAGNGGNNSANASGSNNAGGPRSEDSPMDYLPAPMTLPDEELFSTYLHPPMVVPDEASSAMHGQLHFDYSHSFDHESSLRVY